MTQKRRISWYILVRIVVVSVFLAFTIILNMKYPLVLDPETSSRFIKLIVSTYLFSLCSLFFLRFDNFLRRLAIGQVLWDVIMVTLVITLSGGVTSPYPFLYLLCIVNSSLLLSRRDTLYTAALCSIIYGGMLDLQYYGNLSSLGLSQDTAQQQGARSILYSIFRNSFAFFVAAYMTGYLAERTRKSEHALLSKEIDFSELDRLNTSIVANLNSGLLTLNTDGKIRVFNQFAEMLTGITQSEAYDKYLHEIFPSMCYLGGTIESVQRGEFTFRPKQVGGDKTIGFKSVPLTDANGEKSGIIFIFQDLTQLKTMEEELKKADRLSAIGQLAAHIAHEIRNPLASISGSVQLIAQGDGIDPNDKKLIDIVVRETDRLNNLIRDFLSYSRPMNPHKYPVPVREFLSSLELLIAKDPRFEGVSVTFQCDGNITLYADPDQLEQVFWNLLVNAAESMPGGGTISARVVNGESGKGTIVIADTGCGMDREEMSRVFEPFFTSKKGGTGLGLATVYRIIEAHGGTIAVDSAKGKGTTFTVTFPAKDTDPLKEHDVCSHVF